MDTEKIILYREIKEGIETEKKNLESEKLYYEEIEREPNNEEIKIFKKIKPNFNLDAFRIFIPKVKDNLAVKRKRKEFFSNPEWKPCIHIGLKTAFLIPCVEDKNFIYYETDRKYKKVKNPDKMIEVVYHDGGKEFGFLCYKDYPRNILLNDIVTESDDLKNKAFEFNLATRDISATELNSTVLNLTNKQSKIFNKIVLLSILGGMGLMHVLNMFI